MFITKKSYITKILLSSLIVCVSIVLCTQSLHAQTTASIMLDDHVNPVVTILDNSIDDRDKRLGVVDYSGGYGVFNLSIVVGTTKPFLTGLPEIDLFNVEANTFSGPGSIDVWFSETGFTGSSSAPVYTTVGGTTDDTIEFFSYIDNSDALFGMGTPTGHLGAYVDTYDPGIGDPPLGFSGVTTNTVALSAPYSITGMAIITHGSAGDFTSYDLNVKVAPEPVSSILFIVGGATLGFRRFRNKIRNI